MRYSSVILTITEGIVMTAIEVGRVCVKQFGREIGKKCIIVDVMDKSFVLITGPKKVTSVRRRRVNINHIAPIQVKIDITRGASDDEITSILESSGMLAEMSQPAKP
jgi:large subunit ribosomal protein L14e